MFQRPRFALRLLLSGCNKHYVTEGASSFAQSPGHHILKRRKTNSLRKSSCVIQGAELSCSQWAARSIRPNETGEYIKRGPQASYIRQSNKDGIIGSWYVRAIQLHRQHSFRPPVTPPCVLSSDVLIISRLAILYCIRWFYVPKGRNLVIYAHIHVFWT